MKIAIYHPWLKSRGGAEKLLLEVLRKSEHEISLFTLYYDSEKTFKEFENYDVRVVGKNKKPKGLINKFVRFGLGSIFRKLPLQDFDALIVSEAGLGSLITFRNSSIPTICYCHTPLRAALPEFKETYKKEVNNLLRPLYSLGIKLYNFLEMRAWKRFDKIIANSSLTKERIFKKDLADKEDISIINPGVEVEQFKSGEFQNYFLYPSRFRRYKRQDLAIKAFKEANLESFRLILAGSGQEKEYIEELKEIADESIEIKTDVSDSEWKKLYSNAYSVLFLPKNEDWGIVPLEAMASGKPVIAVDEGGIINILEEGEGSYLVRPEVKDIANKINELANNKDEVREMGKKAIEKAKKYSWRSFVEDFDENVRRQN